MEEVINGSQRIGHSVILFEPASSLGLVHGPIILVHLPVHLTNTITICSQQPRES